MEEEGVGMIRKACVGGFWGPAMFQCLDLSRDDWGFVLHQFVKLGMYITHVFLSVTY